jgi:cysteine desulfurase
MNYFDHAASTHLYPDVLDVLNKSFREDFANPNSQHLFGANLLKNIEQARSSFLTFLNAKKDDHFIFTSSATESNNTVIKGIPLNEGDIIVYSKADHPSLVAPIEQIALEKKLILKVIPLNRAGTINHEEFSLLLNQNVKLVALTHVNNQSGVINDIHHLSLLVKEKSSAHLHLDAAQSFTKIAFNFIENVDSISLTAHKIGGPKGIAGLYLKKNHKVKPWLIGGGQEGGMRSSTQPYPLIMAFHKASSISLQNTVEAFQVITELNLLIRKGLTNTIPQIKWPFENTSPYIMTFIVPKIPSDVFLRHLDARGFCLSSSSACSSKQKGFNPTFMALKIPETFHKFVLRLSLSPDTKEDSINLLLAAFKDVWDDLKYL